MSGKFFAESLFGHFEFLQTSMGFASLNPSYGRPLSLRSANSLVRVKIKSPLILTFSRKGRRNTEYKLVHVRGFHRQLPTSITK
jgi:hypothetical protein